MLLVLGSHLENLLPVFRGLAVSVGCMLESPRKPENADAWITSPRD